MTEASTPLPEMLVPREANGYAIEAFGAARWPAALEALLRGYPASDPAWWRAGFERARAVPSNAPEQPMGMLLHGPSGVAGVVLLYASRRPAGAASQLHVNLSSWAMTTDSREQALWFVRRALREPGAVYTSLTPIASTARILRRVKFETVSHQLVLAVTPRVALAMPAGPRVLDAAATLAALREHPLIAALTDHHRLDCLVCAIETPKGLQPLVFRKRWRRFGVPVAELIYAASIADVAQAAGPLTRFLLRRGYPLMEFEADEDQPIEFPATLLFRRRLAAGPYPRRGVDHLYSELVYLHR